MFVSARTRNLPPLLLALTSLLVEAAGIGRCSDDVTFLEQDECEATECGVCEDGAIQGEAACIAKQCPLPDCAECLQDCAWTAYGPCRWIGERVTCTAPDGVAPVEPVLATCAPNLAVFEPDSPQECSSAFVEADMPSWQLSCQERGQNCYVAGAAFASFELAQNFVLDEGSPAVEGRLASGNLLPCQVAPEFESTPGAEEECQELAQGLLTLPPEEWQEQCEIHPQEWCQWVEANKSFFTDGDDPLVTCEWDGHWCYMEGPGIQTDCEETFDRGGDYPLCTYTAAIPADVCAESPSSDCPLAPVCNQGTECSRGTWWADESCTGTATVITATCTGTIPPVPASCNGTANRVVIEPTCGEGNDANGSPCAVAGNCSNASITIQEECVASCSGIPTNSNQTCDLDPSTDGTDACLEGCIFSDLNYTTYETCAVNTGSCNFTAGDSYVPTCDLDPSTDGTADCLEECIFTAEALGPSCDIDPNTDPQLGTNCPNGCDFTAEVIPVCDLDSATDGTADCPEGCARPRCIECVPGKYSDSSNSTSCSDCPAGTYGTAVASADSADCIPCAAGKYTDALGSNQEGDCISCPPGRFQSMPGQATCDRCSNGTFGVGAAPEGATSEEQECDACSPGQYDDDSDPLTACTDCFPGRYSDTDSSTQCTACAAGTFSLTVGGSAPEVCVQCTSGQWSDAGSVQCAQCEMRYFRVALHELVSTQAQLWSDYLAGEAEAGCLDCQLRIDGSVREGLQCAQRGTTFPMAAVGYYLEGNADSWKQSVPPPDQITQCKPAQACNGGVGESSCANGYSGSRCAACAQGYYREGDLCPQCPPGWPLALLVSLFCAFLIVLALIGDYLANKYSSLSERVAPMMILMTYLQTTSLLLDVPLSWPPALRQLINMLSVVNFNMDLAKPECSFPMDFKLRQIVTLATPLVFLALAKVFLLVQLLKVVVVHLVHSKNPGDRVQVADLSVGIPVQSARTPVSLSLQMKKMAVRVKTQVSEVATGSFVVVSIFFLRTMVGGLDCSLNLDGKFYMDREPATECNASDPYYATVRTLSWAGLFMYVALFILLIVAMVRGGARRFHFLADKMHPKFFWWELVLLVRKVIIMVSALLWSETPEQGWFFCSFVLVIAISLHSYARPFKDDWLNLCEYCSLFSTLLLFMAGMVFKVQSMNMEIEDSAELADTMRQNAQTGEEEEDQPLAPMARALVFLSIGLIVLTMTICIVAELHILKRGVKKKRSTQQDKSNSKGEPKGSNGCINEGQCFSSCPHHSSTTTEALCGT